MTLRVTIYAREIRYKTEKQIRRVTKVFAGFDRRKIKLVRQAEQLFG